MTRIRLTIGVVLSPELFVPNETRPSPALVDRRTFVFACGDAGFSAILRTAALMQWGDQPEWEGAGP